jgi:hypothetical protein
MDLPSDHKRRFFLRVMRALGEHFELVPMGEHARRIAAGRTLPLRAAA